ncbi:MAG: Diguanylate cyclase with sensor [Proteobacteria bacterium]|nr:Diguanylate cyclase with sensor [Pseudomonadota bacterium]
MHEQLEALQAELAQLKARLCEMQQENHLLNEKLTAALDGTDLCLWQGLPQSGELTVFNLQNFKAGDMAPHFDLWLAKLHPEDYEAALTSYSDHLAGRAPFYEAEYRTFRKDGGITWLWDRGRVVERDEQGRPLRIMGAHLDITRRKEYEQRLAQMAHIDPLTSLANRRLLMDRLKAEMERANRHDHQFVVAMLDVDHFKRFNDKHGHEVGDRILVAVARHMEASLREYDLCGRWGGEEFLLILPQTSLEQAHAIVSRLHGGIQQASILANKKTLSVTVSIGMTEYRPGEDFSATLNRADAAMLEAKRRGRDCLLSA